MRTLRFRKVELERYAVSSIVTELDRIGRDREQTRCGSGAKFLYVVVIQKIDATTFQGHIAGPNAEQSSRLNPVSIKFRVTQNEHGYEQITLASRDRSTSYEEAMEIVKHGLKKHYVELPKKPYVFDEGCNKDNWNGYYLSFSGVNNNLWATFDDVFDRAVEEGYFPESLRETCREFGFNIDPYPKNRGLPNIESQLSELV